MSTTAAQLIAQHPTNPVDDPDYHSSSSKAWTKKYPPIAKLNVHTRMQGGGVHADFESAFYEEFEDDSLRLSEPANPPNYRQWRLNSEEDGINWFHTEISNIVLAAWARYPALRQTSHEKPLSETNHTQTVDVSYSVQYGTQRLPVAIGEFKRGLIQPRQWQAGALYTTQLSLSQELRGYADIYNCPQIFCFDNKNLLLLQFRAKTKSDIKSAKCEVDCWVLPRINPLGSQLRYALYRFLAQGFRRCQAMTAGDVRIYRLPPHVREFYNGRPLWKIDGNLYSKPWGHCRRVDANSGAFYWTDAEGSNALLDENGLVVVDTQGFWQSEQQQAEEAEEAQRAALWESQQQHIEGSGSAEMEDLYGPG